MAYLIKLGEGARPRPSARSERNPPLGWIPAEPNLGLVAGLLTLVLICSGVVAYALRPSGVVALETRSPASEVSDDAEDSSRARVSASGEVIDDGASFRTR